MILVDTSVWADHFRKADPLLVERNLARQVVMHPFVVGELAAGSLADWKRSVAALRLIPSALCIDEDAFYDFVGERKLMGSGLSFVDLHILASAAASGFDLWTRDKRLLETAERIGCAIT